jgi:TupA-like ATPgrasp
MPEQVWNLLRTINRILHLVATERMASFALRIKSKKNALTLQQKILYKMAYDKNPMLTIYADKVKVREFVSERAGSEYLTTSFGEYMTIDCLTRENLPNNFVLKSNHGSGASVICWEGAPKGKDLPKKKPKSVWEKYLIHPDDLIWEDLVNLSNHWMNTNYYWASGRFPEWAYKNIEPKIIAEEVLTHKGELPEDYKFFMVNGECKFIQVDVSRFTQHKRDLYSPNWDLLEASFLYPSSGFNLKRPILLTEMVNLARSLSAGIDFIRVDLYCTDSGIKFGELTNYPEGGTADITPKELSIRFAKNWVQNY